jgi:hypothetical protein
MLADQVQSAWKLRNMFWKIHICHSLRYRSNVLDGFLKAAKRRLNHELTQNSINLENTQMLKTACVVSSIQAEPHCSPQAIA